MNAAAPRKLYNTLAVLGYLIGIIAPGSEWRKHLVRLIASCPLAEPAAMGLPAGWQEMPAWRTASFWIGLYVVHTSSANSSSDWTSPDHSRGWPNNCFRRS